MATFSAKIDMSFGSLVKRNNGVFKSAKQAEFLAANAFDAMGANTHMTMDSCYGNSYFDVYHFDKTGVYKVVRHANKSGTVKTRWERADQEAFDKVAQLKEICQQESDHFESKMSLACVRVAQLNNLKMKLLTSDWEKCGYDTNKLFPLLKRLEDHAEVMGNRADKYCNLSQDVWDKWIIAKKQAGITTK